MTTKESEETTNITGDHVDSGCVCFLNEMGKEKDHRHDREKRNRVFSRGSP